MIERQFGFYHVGRNWLGFALLIALGLSACQRAGTEVTELDDLQTAAHEYVTLSPVRASQSDDDLCDGECDRRTQVVDECRLTYSADAVVLGKVLQRSPIVFDANCQAMPFAGSYARTELEVLRVLGGDGVETRLNVVELILPWVTDYRFLEEDEIVLANVRQIDGEWFFGLRLFAGLSGADTPEAMTEASDVIIDLPTRLDELEFLIGDTMGRYATHCPDDIVLSDDEFRARVFREECVIDSNTSSPYEDDQEDDESDDDSGL